MAAVEQQILVKIKTIVEGLAQVQALSSSVRGLNSANGRGIRGVTTDVTNLSKASTTATVGTASLVSGFAALSKKVATGGLGNYINDLSKAIKSTDTLTESNKKLSATSGIAKGLQKLDPFQQPNNQGTFTDTIRKLKRLEQSNVDALQSAENFGKKASVQLARIGNEANSATPKLDAFKRKLESQGISKNNPAKASDALKVGAGAGDLAKVEKQAIKTGGAVNGLTGFVGKLGQRFAAIAALAVAFAAVGAAIGAVIGVARLLGAFVAEGIRFNTVIESARIGIATLVSNTFDLRDASGQLLAPMDSFNAALGLAESLERQLQKTAIQTKYEFEDILTIFNATVAAGAGLNASTAELVALSKDFALAGGARNLNTEQVTTGLKQILTGVTTVRNDLARVVFPGETTKAINEFLKKSRESGTLIKDLNAKLLIFRLSADQVAQSFEAVASNTADAFKVFAAESTITLFNAIKSVLGFIITQIVDLTGESVKLTPTFQKIADILKIVGTAIGNNLLRLTKQVFGDLTSIVGSLDVSRFALRDMVDSFFEIAEQLFGIVSDVTVAATGLDNSANTTQTWAQKLRAVAVTVAFVRDILNIIIGIIQAAEGAVRLAFEIPFIAVGAILDVLTFGMFNFTGKIREATQATDQLAAAWRRVKDGATFSSTRDAASGAITPITGDIGGRFNEEVFASPRNTAAGSGSGAGASALKNAAKERLRAAQQLFDSIEKLQIANTKRDVEISRAANDAINKLYARRYEQGLISAEEFSNKKQELEQADLKLQEESLNKQRGIARAALARDLGAIAGTFALTEEQLTKVEDKLRDLNPDDLRNADATTIKQATELVKYTEQLAAIDTDIYTIGLKRKALTEETTNDLKDQVRLNKQIASDIGAQFATARGQEGVAEGIDLRKRISNELPSFLSEQGKGIPGIDNVAKQIRELVDVDATDLVNIFKDAGIELESLPDPIRQIIDLFGQLKLNNEFTKSLGQVTETVSQLEFEAARNQNRFDTGEIDLTQALAVNAGIERNAVEELSAEYDRLSASILASTVSGVGASAAQLRSLDEIKRKIGEITKPSAELALIDAQRNRDNAIFANVADTIAIRLQAGFINEKQARQELLILTEQQIEALKREQAELLKLAVQTPENAARIGEITNSIAALRNEQNAQSISFAQNLNGQIGGAFSTFLDSIQSGTESIGESFRNLLSGLLLGIAKAIAQALLLKFVLEPLGLTGGSSGGLGGLFGGLVFGKPKAAGGFVEGAGTSVSDSVLTPLSHGEAVLPVNSVKRYGRGFVSALISGSFIPGMSRFKYATGGFAGEKPFAGGAGGRAGVRIINSVDPNLIKDFMSSAAGEEIITNVIGKNPGLVQRLA
jgi:hypothetical protein